MRRRRMVSIEFGTCRSGRIGGASGAVIVGKGRSREERGASSPEGEGRRVGDQEAIGGDTECGVVVEAAPPTPFIIAKAQVLLEILIIALDPLARRQPAIRRSAAITSTSGTERSP